VEVGGGSTELLVMRGTDVAYSHTYRMGSLRMREMLETYRAPVASHRAIMTNAIARSAEEVRRHIPQEEAVRLIALGGDARFAAGRLLPAGAPHDLARLPVADLSRLADEVLSCSVDELVRRYHLTYPDAETAGPALLAYLEIARALQLRHLLVADISMRDGLLMEMAVRGAWADALRDQVVSSALDLGRKCGFDEAHATHVAGLCRTLFAALQDEHHLEPRHELILALAALLHDIGLFVSNRSHHKHSMYLIRNSNIFGVSQRDLLMVALVARYHRRASPKPAHEGYGTLDADSRMAVAKLAAILRVADALDRSDSQRVRDIACRRRENRFVIRVPRVQDLSLERLGLQQKGSMFEEVYGMTVALQKRRRAPG